MLYLKKYFTEGLIQFTILLSLIGVRVDVDTYLSNQLPPLREIILGPSSAYTQTQFHNLRNRLDGYGQEAHPKSVDLDGFFTARRLLGWVRSLDRLQVKHLNSNMLPPLSPTTPFSSVCFLCISKMFHREGSVFFCLVLFYIQP